MKTRFSILLIFILAIALCNKTKGQAIVNPEKQARNDSVAAYLKEAQSLARQGNILDASRIYSRLMESEPEIFRHFSNHGN